MNTIKRKRKTGKKPQTYTATCSAGLEDLVKAEIETFDGQDISTTPGAVSWTGRLETAYRACLWSRFASRILLEIGDFPAPDTDTLYDNVKEIDWEIHFNPQTSFAVYCTLSDSPITHSHFASLRVKDAVVDYFRERTGKRPDIDIRKPGIRLNLHLKEDRASLAIDLSGDSLHRRGYREQAGPAPLKETLAAAICKLSGINKDFADTEIILDPMCGSGTLLIEAAMLVGDSAPGLQRKSFGFMYWSRHSKRIWQSLVDEALEREESAIERPWPQIIGYDADPRAVAAARNNIERAGLSDYITIRYGQLSDLRCPGKDGLLITNPPYGDRLSEKEAVKYLYRFLGRKFAEKFTGWKMGFFSANPDYADMLALKWTGRYSLYNGPIKCRLLSGDWQEKPAYYLQEQRLSISDYQCESPGSDICNRLRKNWQQLIPWAKERDISCFRLYDADLPEYNFAIDIYGTLLHIQEYAPPKTIDPDKAGQRFQTALAIVRELFTLKRSQIFIKTRKPQKGDSQYQKKKKETGKFFEVHEGGFIFIVNFTDFLDTGLFLDHRKTRAMIAELAKGRTFLNLFGYTGSATVYGAGNGATSTTTVDISEKYLTRTLANLSVNGFGGYLHTVIEEDCMEWLKRETTQYGLIFVDPPTFSNSRHRKLTFSVQDDHEQLLRLAMERLAEDGTLIFSTNFRKFSLSDNLKNDFDITEITDQTIPEDFRQKNNIHHTFKFHHHNQDRLMGYI